MAEGHTMHWVTAKISEPIEIDNMGIEVGIWDKWGKTRRGAPIIIVGGIRWHKA